MKYFDCKNKSKFLLLNFFLFAFTSAYGQVGGSNTYNFLDLTNSARVAALGGKNISLNDSDLNMPFHNPALLTPQMNQNVVLNYVSYFAGVNYGYISYALDENKIGTFAIGLHYINYGTFDAADNIGTITGKFYAADYALNVIYSRPINSNFRWGVNLKPIYSSYEKYNSFGIGLDLGITYTTSDNLTTVAAVARNAGFQLNSYTGKYTEPLPFELLLGISSKLQHAPFRFSITLHNLQKYQLRYDLPDEDPSNFVTNTNQQSKFEKFTDNIFRHVIAGVEFLPSKSFYLSFAYNYQRRKELSLQDSPGGAGLSYGIGLRLRKFSFCYGYAKYHVAGGSNHLSFTLNLSNAYHKKQI